MTVQKDQDGKDAIHLEAIEDGPVMPKPDPVPKEKRRRGRGRQN